MGYKFKEGYNLTDVTQGKRDFREGKKAVEDHMFKNPLSLVLDTLVLLAAIIYIPIINLLYPIFGKPKSLRGKVSFVTGSGRGLGRKLCVALAEEGAIIACADINEENNNKTVEIITKMGAKAKGYKLNVANKQEVDDVAKRVEHDLGRVYLLVNNPDQDNPCQREKLDEEYIRATFSDNVLGPMWTTGAFLPKMKEIDEGHIVNISSIGAAVGTPGSSMYCASKAALSNYSQSVRLELSLQELNHIYVSTIHTGMINKSHAFSKFLRINTSENDIVNLIMDSIKYNQGDVSTNTAVFILAMLTKLMPLEIIKSISSNLKMAQARTYNDIWTMKNRNLSLISLEMKSTSSPHC